MGALNSSARLAVGVEFAAQVVSSCPKEVASLGLISYLYYREERI
jgi:hypothetical protein